MVEIRCWYKLAVSLLSVITGDGGIGANGHFPPTLNYFVNIGPSGVAVTKKLHQIFAGAVVAVSISSSYYASVFLCAP